MAVGRERQVGTHQRQVARLDRDVGPATHRDPEVGLGQGRCVVHAVADHRHDVAVVLQPTDDGDLVGGQDLGDDVRDVHLARDVARRVRVVPGQQHRVEAEADELSDGGGAGGPHRVGHHQQATSRAVPANGDSGTSAAPRLRPGTAQVDRERLGPLLAQPVRPPGDDGVPIDHALDAQALGADEVRHGCERCIRRGDCGGRDGAADRVLRRGLERAGECQELGGVDAVGRGDGGQAPSGRSSRCRSCPGRWCRPVGWTRAPRDP